MTATMLLTLAVGMYGGRGPVADTIVEMSRGDRVTLENLSGAVEIEAWERETLEVRSRDRGNAFGVRRSGADLRVVTPDRDGRRRRIDAVIRVPRWAEVAIEGVDLDVRVTGSAGAVRVRVVTGDVRVQETAGEVRVRTVEGEIVADRTAGALFLSAQADDVRVSDAAGALDVRSGSGDLILERVESASVRAETQDGDVRFSGPLTPGGSYGFFVHAGEVVLELPDGTGADVRVSTFDGEFMSEFPVVVPSFRSGRAFEFRLGGGGAALTIEVFDGEIRLVRGAGP